MTNAYIQVLASSIENKECPMAVVDYLDRHTGFGLITEDSPEKERYGVRDMGHVSIHNLKVISLNLSARNKAKIN